MEFDFVGDRFFQQILKRDFKEVEKCIEIGAYKAALVISGSILETILSDYFSENLPEGKTKADILKLSLNTLLELAVQQNVISQTDNNLATVLKSYRNLIHPGREIRSDETLDIRTTKMAFSILELLLTKIEKKYKEKFIHTADDILDKLNEDWNFNSVFGLVISKLSNLEKIKLFEELIEIEIELKEKYKSFAYLNLPKTDPIYPNIEFVKNLSIELIPILPHEILMENLIILRDSIINGDSIESVSFYNLLHEQLGYLNKEDQEFIAIYMLSTFGSIIEDSRDLLYDRTYSTIGKYIHTDKGITAVKELISFCISNFGGSNIDVELDVLEQIINSLSPEHKVEVLNRMSEILLPHKESDTPTLKYFTEEAILRGFITASP